MTDPTPTDWRALCAELVDALDKCQRPYGDQPESFLAWRTRAALAHPEPKMIYRYSPVTIAECGGPCEQGPQYCDCGQIKGEPQPEPQGPSDEELMALAVAVFEDPFSTDKDYARAVLARWGRPAIEPVPVKPAVEEAAKHAVESCLSQREEVLAAFISNHGFHPEDAIQVEQRQEDGTSSWRIERRSAIEPVPQQEAE